MSEPNLVAAQAYEEALVTTLFQPWASRTVEVANPMRGEVILDLACGTGIGLRLMSPLVGVTGKIISVDNDPAMLTVAKTLFANIDDKNNFLDPEKQKACQALEFQSYSIQYEGP